MVRRKNILFLLFVYLITEVIVDLKQHLPSPRTFVLMTILIPHHLAAETVRPRYVVLHVKLSLGFCLFFAEDRQPPAVFSMFLAGRVEATTADSVILLDLKLSRLKGLANTLSFK